MSNTFSLLLPFCGLFSVPSAESRLNCGGFHIQDLPSWKYGLLFACAKIRTRAFILTLQGESYQPESKTQQPPQRRSEFPPRPQAGRQQHKTGRQRQPSRTAPARREWHRPGTPAGQSAGPGGARTGGGPRPGGGPNRPRPAGRRGPPHQGRRHFSKSAPKEENSESEIEVEGTICAVLAGTMFKVRLPNGHEVLAHISGKMRKRFIKIVVGDKVRMEMSPYDMTKARITFRIG